MQFSENWLRTHIAPSLDSEGLAHTLTMAGLEVESVNPVGQDFSGVVVSKIVACEPHPGADRLKLCRVDAGGEELLQIVCGAPNAAEGLNVPCARVGAKLPSGGIRAAKVRGVESFGMLCSARELGLSQEDEGIMVLPADASPGQDLRTYLDLDDRCFTLKLTPNRGDCLSIRGIAREVAALTGDQLMTSPGMPVPAGSSSARTIVLDEPSACPRYCGRVISGIDPAAPTPEWMKRRLERCGVRSISALVDVTNYVMLELGQPMHAFDNAKLSGGIHVRFAREGEQLLLLNGQTIKPASDTLLIADEAEALALAGIMGGQESGVTATTTELFLESAHFSPEAVAGRARTYGFVSEASHRFERGVDFLLAREAIERATQLVLEICGGVPGPVTDATAQLPARRPVRLRTSRVERVLGLAVSDGEIQGLLSRLQMSASPLEGGFEVLPPSFRFDISIEEDLIEEIARLHGYDNVPARPPKATLGMLPQSEGRRSKHSIRQLLTARDYQEVVNYSFVDARWERDFCANEAPILLSNPIASQMSVMRSSLVGGLVGNLANNLRRRVGRVRLYEIGRCFFRDDAGGEIIGFRQPIRLGGLCAGPALPEQWDIATRAVDFFDVKGDVEALLLPSKAEFVRAEQPGFHPGRAAAILLDGRRIGVIGELHPRLADAYELGTAPIAFELDLAVLLDRSLPQFSDLSPFPPVTRDIALVVDQDIRAEDVVACLRGAAPGFLRNIHLFDVYIGKGVEAGKKSVAFRIVMQDTERTLADAEVEAALVQILAAAQAALGARLRG
ncbi:MAG: phenylalanine--tRNA ligase subunit beta [Betaproteobacteria bacterium]|nr:phenylalanine--tRNA ligase subunit beta [Betaproteobacteria bacterium]